MNTVWEYHLSSAPDWKTLGEAGWEMTSLSPNGEYVFKRPQAHTVERFTREQSASVLKGAHPLAQVPRLLNPQLAALARRIGHTQMLIVCDRGFPVPCDLPLGVIDVSLTSDIPTVTQVLDVLLPELPHDRLIVAAEMREAAAERWTWHHSKKIPIEVHPHLKFKVLAHQAVACVRTGDATPYGNVIIVGG